MSGEASADPVEGEDTVKTPVLFATAATALVLGGAFALAGVTSSVVKGKLTTDAEDSEAKGAFRLEVKERGDNDREYMDVAAKGLDAEKDDEGNRPVYDLWLIDADETAEADFGDLRLRRDGSARLAFRSRRHDFPDGVESLSEFGGGTMEIRDADDNVVLSGDIPEFSGLDDDNEKGQVSKGKDRNRLRPDDENSDAQGVIWAKFVQRGGGDNEWIKIKVLRLDADAGPYTAVVIDGETEYELGEIETRGRRDRGKLRLSTKNDDDLPGDSILDLGGADVEIRDADGNVALSGSFPTIE